MKNNVLITGGAGFIGSNLALALVKKGYNVIVLDNLSKQIHGEDPETTSSLYLSIKDKVTFIKGEVNDRQLMQSLMSQVETIVHLAAETGTGQSMYEIERYTHVNIQGTAMLLDILANNAHTVKKIVIASSRAIYGEGKYRSKEHGFVYPGHRSAADMDKGDFEVKYAGNSDLSLLATDENAMIHPSSVYGITKQVQEQLVMTVCPALGIAPVAFRYQNVYGPGQSLKNPYTGIISIFSTLIGNNKEINIFEDGMESRDFVYISDVVNATLLGIEREEANGIVFNVGTGVPTTVLSVAQTLIQHFGKDVPLKITGNYRLGDIRHNYADISRIQTLLGFRPEVDFNTGIRKFVEWVKTQHLGDGDQYAKSIVEMKKRGMYK